MNLIAKQGRAAQSRLRASPQVADAVQTLVDKKIIRAERVQWMVARCAHAYAEFDFIAEPLHARHKRYARAARRMELLAKTIRDDPELHEWLMVTDAAILAHAAQRAGLPSAIRRFEDYTPVCHIGMAGFLDTVADFLRMHGITPYWLSRAEHFSNPTGRKLSLRTFVVLWVADSINGAAVENRSISDLRRGKNKVLAVLATAVLGRAISSSAVADIIEAGRAGVSPRKYGRG